MLRMIINNILYTPSIFRKQLIMIIVRNKNCRIDPGQLIHITAEFEEIWFFRIGIDRRIRANLTFLFF